MKSEAVVVHADMEPLPGIANPGPHQLYRNPRLAVEERQLGDLDPDEIRVQMLYAGICGTDVHLVETNPENGYIRCSAPAVIPNEGRVIGHEGVGKVLATGSHVRHVRPGSYVTFESIIVCHYCDVCRRGQFNQCRQALLLGLEKDGLFGTVVDVPSMLAHDVTPMATTDGNLRAAACIEPAGVAYVACQNTQVGGGDTVVIFGAGPIGVFCAMLSKIVFGASSVHVVEPVSYRRQLARQWCDRTYDVQEFFDNMPASIDVMIEASGQLGNVAGIFRRLNANGRVALLARSGMPLVLDAVDHMITNAITLIGSRGHLCGAFAKILRLHENGRIPLGEVITEVLEGPEELAAILRSPQRILTGNCKVLVRLC
ncbi:MAG: alcohol dehydrogenase catalytic domain-containing protein [Desulforhabdus sp.]|jgi:threonine dehydrogenase-like Zn-dependent dehydrogenase|nr:alcohol dehydrogenase catalytic domain-containing protein [Desulforhabdus sp.]